MSPGYCRVFLLQVCDSEITVIAITAKYYAMLFTFMCSIISVRFIWYRKKYEKNLCSHEEKYIAIFQVRRNLFVVFCVITAFRFEKCLIFVVYT